MVSNSPRAKAIAAGFQEAPASEASCRDSRELAAVAEHPTDTPQERRSSLPPWVSERHAQTLKGNSHHKATKPEGAEAFITVVEAAAELRVSERTIRRHLAEGRIPHIRAGKQIRIPRAGLMKGW